MPEPTPPPSNAEGGTKACSRCGETKPITAFHKHYTGRPRPQSRCKSCTVVTSREYRKANPEAYNAHVRATHRRHPKVNMLKRARQRSVLQGLPFDLSVDDFDIPDNCPVLDIPLWQSDGRPGPHSPSLDRLVPALGYVRDNVVVISNRANVLKRDASLEEIERLASWLARHVAPSPRKRRNPA